MSLSFVFGVKRFIVVPAHLVKHCIQSLEDWNFRWFQCVPTKMDRSSVCRRQVSRFYASGKAMILQQVPLLPSIKLNIPELVLTTVFSSCWLLPSWTHHALAQRHSVNKPKQMATTSYCMPALLTRRTFSVKVKKNLVNSENNENLSNY